MTLTLDIDPNIYQFLNQSHIAKINSYIDDAMTATTFSNRGNKPQKKEIITAEIIYYWMFSSGIPIECQDWHINKLITLIRVTGEKNTPPDKKKRSQKELAAYYAAENQRRRAKYNSKG